MPLNGQKTIRRYEPPSDYEGENKMLELKNTNHDYYCSWGEYEIFCSWKGFKEFRGLDWYDSYLLFRFDLEQYKEEEDWKLKLYYAHQADGDYIWCAIVSITEDDLPEINEYLKNAKNYLLKMWEEIS